MDTGFLKFKFFFNFKFNRNRSSDGLLSSLSESTDAMYNTSNELNTFFGLPGEPEGVDVLEYWKRSANLFPTLSLMAHDIFAIP